jgi:hypothetical protein
MIVLCKIIMNHLQSLPRADLANRTSTYLESRARAQLRKKERMKAMHSPTLPSPKPTPVRHLDSLVYTRSSYTSRNRTRYREAVVRPTSSSRRWDRREVSPIRMPRSAKRDSAGFLASKTPRLDGYRKLNASERLRLRLHERRKDNRV